MRAARPEALRGGLLHRVASLIRRRWWARVAALLVAAIVTAFLPVPWMVARTPNPPGMAWRLDGRLNYEGETIDPPGAWYGLSSGRPPLVAEVVLSWIDDDVRPPMDLTRGSGFNSPAMAEPAAIAIGLARAGRDIEMATVVEIRDPTIPGLPYRAQVARLNGQAITSRREWLDAVSNLGEVNQFVTRLGEVHTFNGPELPYRAVATMGAPVGASVSLAGWLRFVPHSWYRKLALGRSHGLILALAAYTHATGEDLANGRAISGTGVIRSDGTTSAVGGLAAKARAAHRVGVDVFVYPASQRCQGEAIAESLGDSSMTMHAVATLDEAINVLRGTTVVPPAQTDCP